MYKKHKQAHRHMYLVCEHMYKYTHKRNITPICMSIFVVWDYVHIYVNISLKKVKVFALVLLLWLFL